MFSESDETNKITLKEENTSEQVYLYEVEGIYAFGLAISFAMINRSEIMCLEFIPQMKEMTTSPTIGL